MHEIFLSYSRRDIDTVQALATALSAKGLTVWLDRSAIEEGDAYDTQIEDAIAQTRVVIVVWSSTRSDRIGCAPKPPMPWPTTNCCRFRSTHPTRRCNSCTSRRSISTTGRATRRRELFAPFIGAWPDVLIMRFSPAKPAPRRDVPATAAPATQPAPTDAGSSRRYSRHGGRGSTLSRKRHEEEFRAYFAEHTFVMAQVASCSPSLPTSSTAFPTGERRRRSGRPDFVTWWPVRCCWCSTV